jgi:hypothetical protein
MSGNRQPQPEYLLNEEDSNMFEELNLSKKEVLNAINYFNLKKSRKFKTNFGKPTRTL